MLENLVTINRIQKYPAISIYIQFKYIYQQHKALYSFQIITLFHIKYT